VSIEEIDSVLTCQQAPLPKHSNGVSRILPVTAMGHPVRQSQGLFNKHTSDLTSYVMYDDAMATDLSDSGQRGSPKDRMVAYTDNYYRSVSNGYEDGDWDEDEDEGDYMDSDNDEPALKQKMIFWREGLDVDDIDDMVDLFVEQLQCAGQVFMESIKLSLTLMPELFEIENPDLSAQTTWEVFHMEPLDWFNMFQDTDYPITLGLADDITPYEGPPNHRPTDPRAAELKKRKPTTYTNNFFQKNKLT